MRLASVSCSNYPAGYFNVYRCLANRPDLDAVLHLGDYIYEFANGVYGDGSATGRMPLPVGRSRQRWPTTACDTPPIAATSTCRRRTPRTRSSSCGTTTRSSTMRRGMAPRRTRARDAEWRTAARAPRIRPTSNGCRCASRPRTASACTATFRFGRLADLVMLDTRGLRDRQASGTRPGDTRGSHPHPAGRGAGGVAVRRTCGGLSSRVTAWRLLGQQILFAPLAPPGTTAQNTDVWDGYPAARARVSWTSCRASASRTSPS